jgi:hypothetical protein
MDVWILPLPQATVNDCLIYTVTGGYTHTWTSQELNWNVGPSVELGLGKGFPNPSSLFAVGVNVEDVDGSWSTWQDRDGHEDGELQTKPLCPTPPPEAPPPAPRPRGDRNRPFD